MGKQYHRNPFAGVVHFIFVAFSKIVVFPLWAEKETNSISSVCFFMATLSHSKTLVYLLQEVDITKIIFEMMRMADIKRFVVAVSCTDGREILLENLRSRHMLGALECEPRCDEKHLRWIFEYGIHVKSIVAWEKFHWDILWYMETIGFACVEALSSSTRVVAGTKQTTKTLIVQKLEVEVDREFEFHCRSSKNLCKFVHHCPMLTSFTLSDPGSDSEYVWPFDDSCMLALGSHCKGLEVIRLPDHTSVTDTGMSALAENCRGLRSVWLRHSKNLTDIGITKLGECCPFLVEINIDFCAATDAGLIALAEGCPSMGYLGFARQQVTDMGLAKLAENCRELVSVQFKECKNLTDIGLIKLAEYCPRLRSVHFSHCPNITDVSLCVLAQMCPSLCSVKGQRLGVSDAGVEALARFCRQLECCKIEHCSFVTDRGLEALLTCTTLRSASFRGCEGIGKKMCRLLERSIQMNLHSIPL